MSLPAGTRLGPYEVIAPIGQGGMGEVYRAMDSNLKRSVAIKVLPEAVAADRDRLARLQREGEALAALSHPNIAAIFGLERSGGTTALVLELVEGPTLADRLAQGPLDLDEALAIAIQIATALEAAHEQGIIHRDLKPSNIKIKDNGTVKVLDFGLAKVIDPPPEAADVAESPTVTALAMTEAGVLLGTAAYMAPEQVKRRRADKRSDIWAFGCVLFEMLAGRRPFGGDGPEEVLGAVLRLEPDWAALPDSVPAGVRAVIKRCLQKDPSARMRDVADVRFQLEDARAGGSIQPVVARSTRAGYAGWIVAAVVTVAAVIIVALPSRLAPAEAPEVRLQIVTPPGGDPLSFAMSPDGLHIVYAAGPGEPQLWLRSLSSEVARPLAGTTNGTMPFWSPDGGSIGFFADGQLKRIDLSNGFVRALASATLPRRGTWNRDGTIIFCAASIGPLSSIPADGGAVTTVTTLLPGQTGHRWPQFLPDGRRFLFVALGRADVRGLYQSSLDAPQAQRVSDRESAYWLMPPGHILYARQGALWARNLEASSLGLAGDFLPVAPKVASIADVSGYGAISSSWTGSIAFRASTGDSQLTWFDRRGGVASVVLPPDDTLSHLGTLSSDGRTAAVLRTIDGNMDVWLVDVDRGTSRPLTFDPAVDGVPIFSPDGSRVIYASDGKADVYEIYERPANGTGDAQIVLETGENKNPSDWSPDGKYVLYGNLTTTDFDIWALPLSGDRTPLAIVRTPRADHSGRFSPDGRWIAYMSEVSGRPEVWVQPFPGGGRSVQISIAGGRSPRWRRDQRELFYVGPGNQAMAVSIATGDSRIEAGPPRALFTFPAMSLRAAFEPSADGQRFLAVRGVSDPSPITVILNWRPAGR
jgi:Tol biopolymer transport system component